MKSIELLFGFFDIFIIAIIILINWYIFKYKVFSYFPWYVHVILGMTFILILPLTSCMVEYQTYINQSKVTPDGFEILYIWFRFPIYWALGLVEGLIINRILNRNGFIEEGWKK